MPALGHLCRPVPHEQANLQGRMLQVLHDSQELEWTQRLFELLVGMVWQPKQ